MAELRNNLWIMQLKKPSMVENNASSSQKTNSIDQVSGGGGRCESKSLMHRQNLTSSEDLFCQYLSYQACKLPKFPMKCRPKTTMQTNKVDILSMKNSITSHDHKQVPHTTPPCSDTIPLEMQSGLVSNVLNREAQGLQKLEDLATKSQAGFAGSNLNSYQGNYFGEHHQKVILFHAMIFHSHSMCV